MRLGEEPGKFIAADAPKVWVTPRDLRAKSRQSKRINLRSILIYWTTILRQIGHPAPVAREKRLLEQGSIWNVRIDTVYGTKPASLPCNERHPT